MANYLTWQTVLVSALVSSGMNTYHLAAAGLLLVLVCEERTGVVKGLSKGVGRGLGWRFVHPRLSLGSGTDAFPPSTAKRAVGTELHPPEHLAAGAVTLAETLL